MGVWKNIYIFEFKPDGTASEALRQINEKGYACPYEADPRKLYKINISFSSETGTVEEWCGGVNRMSRNKKVSFESKPTKDFLTTE